jgi:hypothetical protein
VPKGDEPFENLVEVRFGAAAEGILEVLPVDRDELHEWLK